MKFNTQLTAIIIAASSVQAQQDNNNFDINSFLNSAVSALNNILPTDQVQSIVTAVSNGIAQNQPTGLNPISRNPTTIVATSLNTGNASGTQSSSQVVPTDNSATPTDSSNTSATPTDSDSASPTDSSNSSTDSSNSSTASDSSNSSSTRYSSSSSSSSQGSNGQIIAPSKYTYVVAGAAFALIGNYLI